MTRTIITNERGDTMREFNDTHWTFFTETRPAGKYLFFSRDRDILCRICKHEIQNHGFFHGKVSVRSRSGSYVLCLYWKNDGRKLELATRYGDRTDVAYRYWKSNADTRAGVYSDEYLNGGAHG